MGNDLDKSRYKTILLLSVYYLFIFWVCECFFYIIECYEET